MVKKSLLVLLVLVMLTGLLVIILSQKFLPSGFLGASSKKEPRISPSFRSLEPSVLPNKQIKFVPQTPILFSIFENRHTLVATLSANQIRTIIVTGDVIPGRSVNFGAVRRNNFKWPFEKTAEVLKSGDLTFINLESPLIKNCQPTSEGMSFCGDQRNIEGFVWAGVDVANLANNHMGNYGVFGIEQTVDSLTNNGILATGINGAVIKDVRGMKFAFLGYNEIGGPEKGISWADKDKIASEVAIAKKQAGTVIVSFHWGIEYTSQPTYSQRDLAHLAIDNGADLVLGNHPHWVQPVEVYKDKLITYAHGNFIFDQMWSEKTKEGVIGRYTFYDNKLIDAEFLPVVIQDYGQPDFPDENKRQQILGVMKRESLKLSIE